MSSSKRDDSSPILKKAGAALQLRSTCLLDLGLGFFLFAFIEHSTAGEGVPTFTPHPLQSLHPFAYYALVLSTKATAKSKFCATAHVEYTQGWSAASTATTTIKVCHCGRCSSDPFHESTEQCVVIVISTDNDASCTRLSSCSRATATET